MIKTVYAGSFDPVTNGHLDIIARAAKLFGSVTVLVMKNDQKTPLFSVEERLEFLRKSTAHLSGVTVETAQGLLADYAKKNNVQILIRGLRGAADIEPEFCQAHFNKQFCPTAETVFLPAKPELACISSSALKEAARAGADISAFVPQDVAKALCQN